MTGSPVWAIALTLGAYAAAVLLWQRAGRHPLLNPTMVAIAVTGGLLLLIKVPLVDYQRDARIIHLLLGPAVVALAVPLYRHGPVLRARASALVMSLVGASSATVLAMLVLAAGLGATATTIISLAPSHATAPVSMAISSEVGGLPALTAVITILAGITGAIAGPALLDALGIRDPVARGFGIGLASHGIGTARAFQESEATGTAAGLAMGLNAILTAALVPPLLALLPSG